MRLPMRLPINPMGEVRPSRWMPSLAPWSARPNEPDQVISERSAAVTVAVGFDPRFKMRVVLARRIATVEHGATGELRDQLRAGSRAVPYAGDSSPAYPNAGRTPCKPDASTIRRSTPGVALRSIAPCSCTLSMTSRQGAACNGYAVTSLAHTAASGFKSATLFDRYAGPGPRHVFRPASTIGKVRLQFQCPTYVFDASLGLPIPGTRHAQRVPGVGVIRVDGENLAVDLLGGVEPPLLMVLNGRR